jgi:hypothetical protein
MTNKRFFSAGLFSLFFAAIVLVSCKDNSECTGIITTCTSNGGIKTPLGNCELIIGQEKQGERPFADGIKRIVATDASGRYEGTWPRQVLIPVEAKKQISDEEYYHGVAFLKLEPGNTTEIEIILDLKEY